MREFLSLEKLRSLSLEGAEEYCEKLRFFLVQSVRETGGHLASNLGVVEISVALARTLNLPEDRILYDTGHQCYVHKILTGRGEAFSTLRTFGGISGFPRREESEMDPFGTGHSTTALSAAIGFARADRLQGKKVRTAVVLGDGSFTGGMVFEALNNIRPEDNILLILNDNGMSISKSVGSFKGALNRLRTAGYYRLKGEVQTALENLPLIGDGISLAAKKIKDSVKRTALPMGNFFEQLGLHYFGPADGNDLGHVEWLLREAMKKNRSAVIHLCTKKGKGYLPAEKDPCKYHGISPKTAEKAQGKSFSVLFGEALSSLAQEDPRIVAISAAMCDGVGLSDFQKEFPERTFDVGIAEEHAMTFAAGLCGAGMKPCFAVYSTFYQRAVDQLLHDAALQKLPVVVCLDRAGISGEDGATHHGLFDINLTLPIPGVKIYAPTTGEELLSQMKRAFAETESPSVIRFPKGGENKLISTHFPCKEEIEVRRFGEKNPEEIQIVSFGRLTAQALSAAEEIFGAGKELSVVRFGTLKGFDETVAEKILSPAKYILFLEEGYATGGFSQYLLSLLTQKGLLAQKKSKILAVGEQFLPHGNTEKLMESCGFSVENIKKEVEKLAQT